MSAHRSAPQSASRRRFLLNGAGLGALTAASCWDRLGLAGALAQTAGQQDFKALVCVFLYGGNDANHMVIPAEPAEYAAYASVRGPQSQGGLAIDQASLLRITPSSLGKTYGLHPNLPDVQALFSSGRAAVLVNAGTLLAPLTKQQYSARAAPIPESLFSHSDQQKQWQSAGMDLLTANSGWGGRLAERVASLNGGSSTPFMLSLSGSPQFARGSNNNALTLPTSGSFGLSGFGTSAASRARFNAVGQILALDRENRLVQAAADVSSGAIASSTAINQILGSNTTPAATAFAGLSSSIALQLRQVAKLIEARATLQHRRQIFFVAMGGYDTHNNQLAALQTLYAQLSPALKAFYDATVTLGVASQVTAFTLSDFSRTLRPASGGGTDHAWGGHHFIVGGAVRGGDFYGRFPSLALAGPDDVSNEGRLLPTTSVDQYAATLAKWFGASDADIALIFPNLSGFATPNLGFLA